MAWNVIAVTATLQEPPASKGGRERKSRRFQAGCLGEHTLKPLLIQWTVVHRPRIPMQEQFSLCLPFSSPFDSPTPCFLLPASSASHTTDPHERLSTLRAELVALSKQGPDSGPLTALYTFPQFCATLIQPLSPI